MWPRAYQSLVQSKEETWRSRMWLRQLCERIHKHSNSDKGSAFTCRKNCKVFIHVFMETWKRIYHIFYRFQNATLGALALSFSSSMDKFSKQIRKLIMSQISHQMKSTSKLEISYLEGSFSGLNDLLVVFPFDLPRERPQLDALCDTIIKCSEFQIGKLVFLLESTRNLAAFGLSCSPPVCCRTF